MLRAFGDFFFSFLHVCSILLRQKWACNNPFSSAFSEFITPMRAAAAFFYMRKLLVMPPHADRDPACAPSCYVGSYTKRASLSDKCPYP
jgi:hypothetical protein